MLAEEFLSHIRKLKLLEVLKKHMSFIKIKFHFVIGKANEKLSTKAFLFRSYFFCIFANYVSHDIITIICEVVVSCTLK